MTQIDGTKEKYILKEQVIYSELNKGSKTFTAYALQEKLKDIRMKLSEGNYQLYNGTQNSVSIDNGVLDEVESQSGWTIGNIDDNARREVLTVKEMAKVSNLSISTFVVAQSGSLIFDGTSKSLNIDTIDNTVGKEPLYISITYSDVETNDGTNFGTVYHDFSEPFHDAIINIQTYYYNEVGNRYSMKYIFTLADGTKTTIIKPFINAIGKLITGTFVIDYTTGGYVKENTILNLSFDTIDDSVYKVLTDVSDVFNVAFEFDTMNKIIHVHSLSSLGSITNETSSQLGQFILGTSKLGSNPYTNVDSANLMLSYKDTISINKTDTDSEIISGLKIIGKDDLSIINLNPNGTDVIENWDYFINNGNLTTSCISALDSYKYILKTRQSNWNTIKQSYLDMSNTLITYSSQVKSYQGQVVGLQGILSGYRAVGDETNANLIQIQLTAMQTKLDSATNSEKVLTDNLKELEETMAEYSEGNKKENIVDSNNNKVFSYSDLQVLYDLINIETINDDYFSDELSLYEHYVQVMNEKVKPKTQFTTKTGNMYKYVYLNSNILKLGLWYDLDKKLKEIFNEERIRLISYEYYPNKGKEGSFENLIYSSKVTSINMFKRNKSNTNIISKTSQMVSKVTTETTKLSNTITEKIGNGSLIDYKDNTAQELDNISSDLSNKLSSDEFDTKFNKRQSDFDFTMGSNSTYVKIDKDRIKISSGGGCLIKNSLGKSIIDTEFNMPKIADKGISDITLEVGETTKTRVITTNGYQILDYSVICHDSYLPNGESASAKLPYYRINPNYNMDEGVIFSLVGIATMDGINTANLLITFTRPENYKNTKETFQLQWVTYTDSI